MFLKRIAITACVLFMLAGNAGAEGNRVGVQFESGGNLGVIYYGNNFEWAAGGSVGFREEDTEIESMDMEWDTDSTEFSVFARKNFNLADKTYLGLGVMGSWAYWDDSLTGFEDGVTGAVTMISVEAESWSVAPYFILDYHVSKDFILNAGAKIVTFETIDYEWAGDDEFVTTDSTSYFDPFFGITYLF